MSQKVDIKELEKVGTLQFHKDFRTETSMKVFIMIFLYCVTFGDSKYSNVPKINEINELLGRFHHIIGDNFVEENPDESLAEFESPGNVQEVMDQQDQKYYSISRLFRKRSVKK